MPAVVRAPAERVADPVLHQVASAGRRAHPVAAIRPGLDLGRHLIVELAHVVRSDPAAPDPAAVLAAHAVDQGVRVDAVTRALERRLERELALLGTGIEP